MADWKLPSPEGSPGDKGLVVYNSLTRSKVPFIPKEGNRVNWYICGPTVYDSSHLGHARSYLSFDIIRRILEEYFGYDVFCVMNITDIDDKIIMRTRENHFFQAYVDAAPAAGPAQVAVDLAMARAAFNFEEKMAEYKADPGTEGAAKLKLAQEQLASLEAVQTALEGGESPSGQLLEGVRDVMSKWLAAKNKDVELPREQFEAHARKFETEYLEDMATLGVRPPHALTRVSEYVDDVVEMIEKIVSKDLGYEANGSVYFDSGAFMQSGHEYCKLDPGAQGNAKRLLEGEGALSAEAAAAADVSEKKAPIDFALWKASKPGEPSWDSPWGPGRPGWHIECSAMAGAILGDHLDIHGGGEDLKFPHHDNELAQSEAYFGCHQWTSYFLHAGHLHIEGAKMSKSLKNFLTIRQALELSTPRQIRLLFLRHPWVGGLDYSAESMNGIKAFERKLREFFLNVSTMVREEGPDRAQRWDAPEFELEQAIAKAVADVDAAIKDSFDTKGALEHLEVLIKAVSAYRVKVGDEAVRGVLLMQAARFVARILSVFGVIDPLEATAESSFGFAGFGGGSGEGASSDEISAIEALETLSRFRDAVRAAVRAGEPASTLLQLSDDLRDNILPELGVRLEDRDSGVASIKIDDRAVLLAEREEKRAKEEAKAAAKAAKAAKAAAEQAARDARDSTPPAEFFKLPEFDGQFSAFDDTGFPTQDGEGNGLGKGKIKKLGKLLKTHLKKHEKWLARQ